VLLQLSHTKASFCYVIPDLRTYHVLCIAITVDAGVQWYEAYNAAKARGRIVVGGITGTVGAAGGWVMGGGHSPLSPRHGLGTVHYLLFLWSYHLFNSQLQAWTT
jgi:hypothetical protein